MVRRSYYDIHSRRVFWDGKCEGAFVAAGQGTYYDPLGQGCVCDECSAGVPAADDETRELEKPERPVGIRHAAEK